MLKPSASKPEEAITIIIPEDIFAPTAPEITAKVVITPSTEPKIASPIYMLKKVL